VKKLVVIFFLLIYGFASVGATVHTHYCMGEYVGATLLENKGGKCGKCGMKESNKKNGCCKDEHKEFKLKTDHQKGSVADFVKVISAPVLLTPIPYYHFTLQQNSTFLRTDVRPPPNIQKLRLHILYAVFLI
jgi:hypothetical protein